MVCCSRSTQGTIKPQGTKFNRLEGSGYLYNLLLFSIDVFELIYDYYEHMWAIGCVFADMLLQKPLFAGTQDPFNNILAVLDLKNNSR